MKIFAVNGSPAGDSGNTSAVLNPFLAGAAAAGAEVVKHNVKGMKIRSCLGCYKCWYSHGTCCIKDDASRVMPDMLQADVWVLATPLYTGGMTAPLKALIDRTFSASDHHIHLLPGGKSGKVPNPKCSGGKLVLISSCGLYETTHFDVLVSEMQEIARIKGREFAGALLRPHAGLMQGLSRKPLKKMDVLMKMVAASMSPVVCAAAGDKPVPVNITSPARIYADVIKPFTQIDSMAMQDVVVAAEAAGSQLVRSGRISDSAIKRVSQPLVSVTDYVRIADAVHREMFAANVS